MLVSKFLVERLENAGVRHVFGVPGDYISDFFKELSESRLEVVGNTDENHAGFAADAYARANGVGCVAVTYSVGAAKIVNAVQCAYAERSPMIVISGAPGMDERNGDVLLHHMVGSFNSQKKMFENITCSSVVLDDPATAGYQIDCAMESLKHFKRPIYIELPRDVSRKPISYDVYKQGTPVQPKTHKEILDEAIQDTIVLLNESKRPVIVAGVELGRCSLGEKLLRFAERSNIPVVTTMLSKSVVNESHPLFAGTYSGASSFEHTSDVVENSDCIISLGVMLTDVTFSFKPSRFQKKVAVTATIDGLQVKNHGYSNVQFVDYCECLFNSKVIVKDAPCICGTKCFSGFSPMPDARITVNRLFQQIDSMLTSEMVVVADMGDSLFGAVDLTMRSQNSFYSPAFYTSMGNAIPGALGLQVARPNIRPIVIVGDGAFQMSCGEISTIIDRGLNPIIFVLDNGGYQTEKRSRLSEASDDYRFNTIKRWNYHQIVQVFGGGVGCLVGTEKELAKSVSDALDSKVAYLINVRIGPNDISERLRRILQLNTV